METLLSRYRSLTVLLLVVFTQLIYLAYQVKTNRDERLIRVWAVTAVTPMAGLVEALRHNTIGFLQDYFILLDVREQDRKLKTVNDQLRLENIYLRNEVSTAENARILLAFQQQSPSKTIAARVIGNSTVATAKAVFIDRGSTSGIESGMPVVTPDGIVGKVTAVYPLVSQVLLVTDPTFKVGIESQKGHVHGVLNCGTGNCSVEQVQNEDRVDGGEWFFTSGEDRVFPKGFPVGTVVSSQPGQGMRDIKLNLSGAPGSAEEILVVLHGVHQQIPREPPPIETSSNFMGAPPSEGKAKSDKDDTPKAQTEADKIREHYDELGKAQGHVFGGYGSNLPNFNAKDASLTTVQPDGTAKHPDTAASEAKPAPIPAIPVPPALLGGRPTTKLPGTTVVKPPPVAPPPAPAKPADNRPTYLGSPKRKPTTTPRTDTSTQEHSPGRTQDTAEPQ